MNKKLFSIIIGSLLIIESTTVNGTEIENKDTANSIATQEAVISQTASQFSYVALDWVTSQITSHLGNYLVSSIFGSGGGSSVVTLSEESYQRIESIINRQLDSLVRSYTEADLRSLQDGIFSYDTSKSLRTLETIDSESRALINSPAFEKSFNEYKFMTETFSIAASLRYAVTAERVYRNINDPSYAKITASQLLDRLQEMGNATTLYIREKIKFSSKSYLNCDIIIHGEERNAKEAISTNAAGRVCYNYYVKDSISGHSYRYLFADYGTMAGTYAINKYNSLRDSYKAKLLGNRYNEVLEKLEKAKNLDASKK